MESIITKLISSWSTLTILPKYLTTHTLYTVTIYPLVLLATPTLSNAAIYPLVLLTIPLKIKSNTSKFYIFIKKLH